ncbi:uncharacterized protein DFL_000478 [Arthrobotrys flagrans]|uniref:Aminoglycoside phosphotransferase domain-containing protein n=1 Tax=Arthrobotrys flagrans TaxID=97331 RepID=A0A437AED0_ARTFL|nr:hypothetical protein DFL_000478 [Arthrobotrys flagrans]
MALHEILTDAQLAELCHSPDRILINPHVVKISDEAVIKFGWLQPEEAENLRIAGGHSRSCYFLCHLDLAPLNIIRKDDGTLYLVDWESAGYYPEGFELAGLELKSTNATKFEYMLQEKLGEDLGADDNTHTESKTILEAWLGGDRTYFKPTEISNWRRCPTLDIRAYMIRNGFLPKAVAPTPSIPPSAAKHKTTTQYLGPLLFAVFRTDLNGINVKMISLRAGLQARLQAHGLSCTRQIIYTCEVEIVVASLEIVRPKGTRQNDTGPRLTVFQSNSTSTGSSSFQVDKANLHKQY